MLYDCVTVTHNLICNIFCYGVTVVTVTSDIILIPNPKSKNKKINEK